MKAYLALLSNLLLLPTGTNFAASFVATTKGEHKVGQSAGRLSRSLVFKCEKDSFRRKRRGLDGLLQIPESLPLREQLRLGKDHAKEDFCVRGLRKSGQ